MLPKRTDSLRSNARGYTLIELMIVLIVLVVGILVIARLFPAASRALVRDRLRTQGVYYAQQKVETLRTMQENDVNLSLGRHPSETDTEALGLRGSLKRYWNVTRLNAPIDNILRVDVVVSWVGPAGTDSVVATSYVNH